MARLYGSPTNDLLRIGQVSTFPRAVVSNGPGFNHGSDAALDDVGGQARFTAACWMYLYDGAATKRFFAKSATGSDGWRWEFTTPGILRIVHAYSGTDLVWTGGTLQEDRWQCIAVTFNTTGSSSCQIYIGNESNNLVAQNPTKTSSTGSRQSGDATILQYGCRGNSTAPDAIMGPMAFWNGATLNIHELIEWQTDPFSGVANPTILGVPTPGVGILDYSGHSHHGLIVQPENYRWSDAPDFLRPTRRTVVMVDVAIGGDVSLTAAVSVAVTTLGSISVDLDINPDVAPAVVTTAGAVSIDIGLVPNVAPAVVTTAGAVSIDIDLVPNVAPAVVTTAGAVSIDIDLVPDVAPAVVTTAGAVSIDIDLVPDVAPAVVTTAGDLTVLGSVDLTASVSVTVSVVGAISIDIDLVPTVAPAVVITAGTVSIDIGLVPDVAPAIVTTAGVVSMDVGFAPDVAAAVVTTTANLTILGTVDLTASVSVSGSVSGNLAVDLALAGGAVTSVVTVGTLALDISLVPTVAPVVVTLSSSAVDLAIGLSATVTGSVATAGSIVMDLDLSGALSAVVTTSTPGLTFAVTFAYRVYPLSRPRFTVFNSGRAKYNVSRIL